jgi:hypothetical protein
LLGTGNVEEPLNRVKVSSGIGRNIRHKPL